MPKDRTPAPYRDLTALLHAAGWERDASQAEETRARVVRALASFERTGKSRIQAARVERQLAIITRCDLGGQLHKVVASDLGISMRTFYRERVEAFGRLREALDSDRSAAGAPPPSATAVHLERARVLGAQGCLREAIERLGELPVPDGDALLAAAIAARLAALWLRVGDVERSDRSLAHAKRCAALLGNGVHHAVALAEIAIADAVRLRAAGAFAAVCSSVARIAQPQPRASYTTPDRADAMRAAVVLHVDACLDAGSAAQARSLLANAARLMQDESTPLDVRLDLALAEAEAELIADADCPSILRRAADVCSLATAQQLPRHAVRAQRLLALVNDALGNAQAARASLKSALETIRESLIGEDARSAALDVAAASLDLGDAAFAMRVLDIARGDRAADEALRPLILLRQAQGLLLQNRVPEALQQAREAHRNISARGPRRHLGEALLVLARVLVKSKEYRAGRSAALEAAALLDGSSWPWHVRDANVLAGRTEVLTPASPEHQRSRTLTAS